MTGKEAATPDIPVSGEERAALEKAKVERRSIIGKTEEMLKAAETEDVFLTQAAFGNRGKAKDSLYVAINGYAVWVPVGIKASVPKPVAQVLRDSGLIE
jgi:hypothetical protein